MVGVYMLGCTSDQLEGAITHRSDARVVRKHKPADAVVRRNIWRPPCQCYLDGCRAPRYEIGKLAFSDAEK